MLRFRASIEGDEIIERKPSVVFESLCYQQDDNELV
jgi:hypothetical protein